MPSSSLGCDLISLPPSLAHSASHQPLCCAPSRHTCSRPDFAFAASSAHIVSYFLEVSAHVSLRRKAFHEHRYLKCLVSTPQPKSHLSFLCLIVFRSHSAVWCHALLVSVYLFIVCFLTGDGTSMGQAFVSLITASSVPRRKPAMVLNMQKILATRVGCQLNHTWTGSRSNTANAPHATQRDAQFLSPMKGI